MSHPLDGTRAKMRRAKGHLDEIRNLIEGFLDSDAYTARWEPDANGFNEFLRAQVRENPPDDWGAIIGDFAHNARSALDLLVYELARLTKRNPSDTGFPIFLHPKDFDKFGVPMLAHVQEPYWTFIKEEQPFNRGQENSLLWLLAGLNNTDKHRLIHTGGGFFTDGKIGFPKRGPQGRVQVFTVGGGILEDNVPILMVHYEHSDMARQMDVEVHLTRDICFAEGSERVVNQPVRDVLLGIFDRVSEVIGKLEKAFP